MRGLFLSTVLLSTVLPLLASAEDFDLSRDYRASGGTLDNGGVAAVAIRDFDADEWKRVGRDGPARLSVQSAVYRDNQDVSQITHQAGAPLVQTALSAEARSESPSEGKRRFGRGENLEHHLDRRAPQSAPYLASGRGAAAYDAGNQVSPGGKKIQLSEKTKITLIAVLSVFFIILINGIRLGLTDKMIFYENWWDVFLTVLVWLLPSGLFVGSFIVGGQTDPNSELARLNQEFKASEVLAFAAFAAWPLMVLIVFIKNIRLNGFGFGSLSVFIAKLTLSFLLFFSWGRWNDTSKTLDVRLSALLLFALIAAFTARLVNGAEVKHTRLVEVTS